MSHRGVHAADKRGFFIRLPDDLKQLPLYSNATGYSIRDESLSERVQRALLHDYHHPDAITKPILQQREHEPWWRPWWYSIRYYLAVALSHCAAFSLGSALAGRHG